MDRGETTAQAVLAVPVLLLFLLFGVQATLYFHTAQLAALAAQGLRCLAIAEIPNAGELSNLSEANKTALLSDISTYNKYEQGATFIGIVCIKDPVRPEIK